MPRRLLAITLAALSLSLAGCASSPEPDSAVGRWGSSDDQRPHLDLGRTGQFTGSDGCNGIGGRWDETEPGVVEFTDTVMTLMMCDDVPDQWLSRAASARLDGRALVVFDQDGQELGSLPQA